MQKFYSTKAKILSNVKITDDIFKIKLDEPSIAKTAKPGQFVNIRIPGKILRRPLSIFSAYKNNIVIVFKIQGEGTSILSRQKPSEYLDILGPLGNGFPKPISNPLFIAGGIGMAPLNFLSSSISSNGTFIYAVKKEADFVPLKNIVSRRNKLIKISEEKDCKLATDILPLYLKEAGTVYIAGPREMIKSAAAICLEHKKTGFFTWEERMGCGTGFCQGCVIKTIEGYKRTCKDGPVFSIDEVDYYAF
ncbi:FAD-binding oxidoreductase [Elusimicrobiota bacterium]